MKKSILFLIIGLSFTTVQSQNTSEAIRYAQDNLNGTARFRAMGGAFGALGGDFSSLNVNPAGSAVFMNNQIAVTLDNYDITNKSNYFDTKTSENNGGIDLTQLGGVFVFKNYNKKSDWKKFSLALNYENTNNLNNSIYSAGVNPTNSIDKYFLYFANANPSIPQLGIPLNVLENYYYDELNFSDQQAFLGYHGQVIQAAEPDDPNNAVYISNVPAGGDYYQENNFESTGYNGKLSLNFASQYKDKLYFGINLNTHFTDYTQSTSFYEDNSNDVTSGVQRLRFDNELYTYGSGFSFQLGAIAKVNKTVRLGLAYESPTWYQLNDELTQSLAVVSADAEGELPTVFVNPNVINIYEPYQLKTPGKWTGSLAFVFGKSGLLSVDYAIKDYSNTEYQPKNEFRNTNTDMSNRLGQTGELRIGGEHKIKEWSLRAGYRMEQSPYKDGKTIGDLTGYSGGFGYNFGSARLDFAYSQSQRDSQKQFFSQGLTDSAKINTVNKNFTVTLVFSL